MRFESVFTFYSLSSSIVLLKHHHIWNKCICSNLSRCLNTSSRNLKGAGQRSEYTIRALINIIFWDKLLFVVSYERMLCTMFIIYLVPAKGSEVVSMRIFQ